jgi:hypothetical protein
VSQFRVVYTGHLVNDQNQHQDFSTHYPSELYMETKRRQFYEKIMRKTDCSIPYAPGMV